MGHLRAYRAAADGKLRGSNDKSALARRLIFAAVTLFSTLFLTAISVSASYAQSGPFTGLAGVTGPAAAPLPSTTAPASGYAAAPPTPWAPAVTGSTRPSPAPATYKFNLSSNVVADGAGALSGTWSETGRNVNGTLQGHGANGNFQVVASAPGFNANISLTTRGNKQSVVIKTETAFRGATISLSRS